ncbi:putative protein phosphatase 2C 33 [Iris pallida]|uniref:Uncharacterized protein n=1 Tax=Iris pallida TaxID=29817 RepID=A0AAX6H415_IRIPA|nr:putative protein phosphatase 2C 33 [Iris pallida]
MPSEFLFEKGQFSVGFLTAMAHLDIWFQVRSEILSLKLSAQWEVINGNNDCKANSISIVGSMNSEAMSSVYLEEESRGSFDFEERERSIQRHLWL